MWGVASAERVVLCGAERDVLCGVWPQLRELYCGICGLG